MLRFTIISTLAILGSVRATVYIDVGTVGSYPGNSSNKYFGIRSESSEDGEIFFLVIKREITEKNGIQLCETWKYDERGFGGVICGDGGSGGGGPPVPLPPHAGDIINGPNCQKLCCALDDLADKNHAFPRPDEALGLRGQRCPLKKGSYRIPSLAMPDPLTVDFTLLPDYTDYSSGLFPSGHCTSSDTEKAFAFLDVVFVACKKKY